MARIFMSMSGEGRGHAARVGALVDRLRDRHELTVFAPSTAYELLAPLGRRRGFEVQRIPGITNRYTPDRRFDLVATGLAANSYLRVLPGLIHHLEHRMRSDRPDLVITDFEPALPRAAQRCDVPYISIDHQHVLTVSDLSMLPVKLQWHAFWARLLVHGFYHQQCATVVSSFYFPPLKPEYEGHVVQIGVLLRPAVYAARPCPGDHLVAYFRRFAPRNVLDALAATRLPVHIYGLGDRGRRGRLEFRGIDGDRFIEDLSSCRALVATAGNQLVGEALYLGKPVLVMPEADNFEQSINAFFLEASGGGTSLDIEACRGEDIQRFLRELDRFALPFERSAIDGTTKAVAVVEGVLGGGAGRGRRHIGAYGKGLEAA